jgi:endonuclease YncB( thermonuclease family)
LKKAWRLRHAFFYACVLSLGLSAKLYGQCLLTEQDKLQVEKFSSAAVQVVDGDSLRLHRVGQAQQQLRLAAVNTPEFTPKPEPLAVDAQRKLQQLVNSADELYWLKGLEEKDRYGRALGHLFLPDGRNIAAELVAEGLGFAIAMEPNLRYSPCVFKVQQQAKANKKGIWQNRYFLPIDAEKVPDATAGFKQVVGSLQAIDRSRSSVWLELEGDVVLRIKKADLVYFDEAALKQMLNKRVIASGWVVDRASKSSKAKSRYARYMLLLTHPLHLVLE